MQTCVPPAMCLRFAIYSFIFHPYVHVSASVCNSVPGVRTAIPPQLQYPMRPQGVSFAQGLLNLLYADSIMGRIKGVLALCK